MKSSFIKILFLLIFCSSVNAQGIYEFLKLDTSPRAAALAGSFVSNSDDPNVIFYNPAGLFSMEKTPVSFSFVKHLMDINSASLAGSYDLEGIGRIGAAIQYINYGTFTEATQFGVRTGEFGASDLAMALGYSNQLDENFNYGANVKFIYSGIAEYSSVGLAMDIGLQYLFPETRWSFGLSILNLGTQLTSYAGLTEDLPLDITFGFTKRLERMPLAFSFALKRLNEADGDFFSRFNKITFGAEINLSKTIDVRLGYNSEERSELKIGTSAGLAGFHVGLGIHVKTYRIDYSYSSMGSIGALHRFGVSTNVN